MDDGPWLRLPNHDFTLNHDARSYATGGPGPDILRSDHINDRQPTR